MKKLLDIGVDVSTSAVSIGGRTAEGEEAFTSVPMAGATEWHGKPAFDLTVLPGLLEAGLDSLAAQGFGLAKEGNVSFSVRQHDLAICSQNGKLLMPALSWQCNVDPMYLEWLDQIQAAAVVGPIEPRFIIAKLLWVLDVIAQSGEVDVNDIVRVMTTGDYIAWMLTGQAYLSTSDALSNGLLNQRTKELALGILCHDELPRKPNMLWFPPVIQSGRFVGSVMPSAGDQPWAVLRRRLEGWKVYAGLGDNHAGAIGCGLGDLETVVVSAGTSGTVVRMVGPDSQLHGQAACFEYFMDRLLLMMLHRCAPWYDQFRSQFGIHRSYHDLDVLAAGANLAMAKRVRQKQTDGAWQEEYPCYFRNIALGEQVASVLLSIAVELAERVRLMIGEVKNPAAPIKQVLLTGGLSQSEFFRSAFATMLEGQGLNLPVLISNRQGPMVFQAATFGAMVNAMVGAGKYPTLQNAMYFLCPRLACEKKLPLGELPSSFKL